VNRDLGAPIAAGNEAELFAWDAGSVLKLSKRIGDPRQAEHEAMILAAIAPLGLAPEPRGVIEVNGRWGLVMERIDLPVMASANADPGHFPEQMRLMVSLHRRIHSVQAPGALPRLKQRMATRIDRVERLSRAERDSLLAHLAAMPDGDRMCHGDFHPFNILGLDENARVIDWLDATAGDPAADVCRTYVLISAYKQEVADAYIAAYLDASGLARADIDAWLPFVAAARLAENVPAEFERLAELARGATPG
jgi:aminoglycoside phosphotransferase (APT) family kinase protein